jgi:hypothetical protein
MIHDGFKMNDASTTNVTHQQTNTLMEGDSKITEEQMIIVGGSKDTEEQLTMITQTKIDILGNLDVARNKESNSEDVHMDDGSIGYESLLSNCDSTDSSVKVCTNHVKKT